MHLPPALILLLFANPIPTESPVPEWGAEVLNNTDRPQDSWKDNFNNITPIPVQGHFREHFYNALYQCPENDYCVLSIDQLILNNPIYLNRSKIKVIGLPNNKVTFPNQQGYDDEYTYFVVENNTSEVMIEGLNIDGESQIKKDSNGLLIRGNSISKIIFYNNDIHHIYVDDGNAHGIAVLGAGSTESAAISQIIIDSNFVHDMKTGSGENIAINGNVKNWEIKNNRVHDVNNIAIDAIGGEGTVLLSDGTSATTIVNGRVFPHVLDSARYGFIENNTVLNMSTATNAAYLYKIAWAAAIYVDGAHHIKIANNYVSNTPWAYEVGAENCIISNNITIINNTAQESWYGDALFGGYTKGGYLTNLGIECDPAKTSDDVEGHGYVDNITITGNDFLTTKPAAWPTKGNIKLQYRIRHSIINQADNHIDGSMTGNGNSIRIE